MNDRRYDIHVSATSAWLAAESDPERRRYVFSYTIVIEHHGTATAQLLTRHWIVTDAHGKVQEVRGDGVVGEQPVLLPGARYRYTSGALIETPVGTMHGSYGMIGDGGHRFDVEIPAFRLAVPYVLN